MILKREINEIVKKNLRSKTKSPLRRNSFTKGTLYTNYENFVLNADELEEQRLLLKVIKETKNYTKEQSRQFCNTTFWKDKENNHLLSSDILFVKRTDRLDASTNKIVSYIIDDGNLFKTININCEFDNNLKNNNYENKTVYYFDDFCGSGEQLIKTLRKLEGSLINCKIKIVIFAWLHIGYQNLISFLKNEFKTTHNNEIILVEDNIIILESFADKFTYEEWEKILTICKMCTIKGCQQGYRNSQAMITFDYLSPNNNLPLIWTHKIDYLDKSNQLWYPFSSRKNNKFYLYGEILTILKKKGRVDEFRKKINNYFHIKLTYNQFRLILFCMNFRCLLLDDLVTILGYDNKNQLIEDIEIVNHTNIIDLSHKPFKFNNNEIFHEFKKVHESLFGELFNSKKKKNTLSGQRNRN